MIFYLVLCVVLQPSFGYNDKTTHKMAAATVKPKMDRSAYKKIAELIYFINEIYNNQSKLQEEKHFNNDRKTSIKQLMKLIQKNYDASKLYKEKPKVRVHFISNPEVLEQFKDVLKEKESSSYEVETVASRQLKEILRSLRRQAVFRIDDPESEEKTVPEEQRNVKLIQHSTEDNEQAGKVNVEANGIHNSRKKETESKENAGNNAWDVITKKYDWDKDNWDQKDQKDWGGKGGNISDEKKKIKNDKWDDWGKDKKDTWDDVGKDKKKDDKWDDWGLKDKKDKNKGLKKKNIDKLEEWGQKDKKDKWDDLGKKKDSWDDWGEKKETLKTWGDKPKKKVEIKWEQPKNKRKGSDTKEKKSEWDNKWDKKDNWDNWEPTTRQKRKSTKKKSQSFKKINEWEHYIPKVQNKAKRHEFERNAPAGAFGRTSIPFVGKKGIYEDK